MLTMHSWFEGNVPGSVVALRTGGLTPGMLEGAAPGRGRVGKAERGRVWTGCVVVGRLFEGGFCFGTWWKGEHIWAAGGNPGAIATMPLAL